MDYQTAWLKARARYGDVILEVVGQDCVIYVREGNHHLPRGYGSNWEDALVDAARQDVFAEDCAYA